MLRVLPITLVAILMVLPLKLGSLMEGLPVVAQQFDREFGKHERPWAKDLKGGAEASPDAAAEPASTLAGPAVAALPATPAAPPMDAALPAASCTDPALRAAISEQKADVTARTRHLGEAEAVLAAAETRATAQIQKLSAIKRDVEALMQQRSNLQAEDLKRMVTIYETMKPRDAARIFNDLETDIIIDVLDRMAERRSAPIIAELEDGKAREVTRLVLQRRALPGDRPPPPAPLPVRLMPTPTN
ncbi:flagellar motility protein MotE (MotC chaperone) [Azospirillum brasilense]|uniref:Flagellar motility protein MotE (MotC chaperone) n=1 Tax=Azospirillum brasilense TaxID=192 RepID=A0A560BRA4_AZOBR|nr:flagellar motor switch protein [Azospirillum brasilense]TWA75136.1 flagellar motility protein MotE (MotC chaperone) [Azospirillum brasilense]